MASVNILGDIRDLNDIATHDMASDYQANITMRILVLRKCHFRYEAIIGRVEEAAAQGSAITMPREVYRAKRALNTGRSVLLGVSRIHFAGAPLSAGDNEAWHESASSIAMSAFMMIKCHFSAIKCPLCRYCWRPRFKGSHSLRFGISGKASHRCDIIAPLVAAALRHGRCAG